jgi:hypothetical protein
VPYLALALLGAFHGINPGMGWLFAVALGMQEQERRAVWRALVPLAVGHAIAIVLAIAAASALGLVLPMRYVTWIVAAVLLGFGAYRLVRHRHPRWGGMRVGPRDLAIWSLLMATAHGAGLMALPFVLRASAPAPHAGHAASSALVATSHATHAALLAADLPSTHMAGLAAALVHTGGYLLATGVIAVVVFEKVGLRVLRRAWVNLDLLWALALIGTALLTLLL